jgi:hypothetical protein
VPVSQLTDDVICFKYLWPLLEMNALNGKKILSPVFSKIIYACENSWNCTHVIFHTFYMLEEIIYSHKKGHYILIKGPINQDDNDCKDIYIYIY